MVSLTIKEAEKVAAELTEAIEIVLQKYMDIPSNEKADGIYIMTFTKSGHRRSTIQLGNVCSQCVLNAIICGELGMTEKVEL